MSHAVDDRFYARADAVIALANEQLADASRGKVSASTMYAVARFNAWVSAHGFRSGADMRGTIPQTVAYFVDQYRAMLEENLADYADRFDAYMQGGIHDGPAGHG